MVANEKCFLITDAGNSEPGQFTKEQPDHLKNFVSLDKGCLSYLVHSITLSLSLTPNYILYQKSIVCCCWLNQRPPIVTMPASCSSTIKMSVFNLCCTLYSTHSLTLSINSLSLPPFLAVLRILMSCLCFVSVSVRLNNRLEFRLLLGE